MIIKTISYSCLTNLGNYENERIEAIAEIAPDDDPAMELDDLKDWVHERCGFHEKYKAMRDRYDLLKGKLDKLEQRLKLAHETWNQTAEFLRAQGLRPDAPDFPIQMLPALPEAKADDDDILDGMIF